MAKKIITFTINNATNADYEAVQHKINQISIGWAQVDQTTYLMNTDRSSVAVRESIKEIKTNGEFARIFVCEWSNPSAWTGLPKEIADWIRNS